MKNSYRLQEEEDFHSAITQSNWNENLFISEFPPDWARASEYVSLRGWVSLLLNEEKRDV